MTCLWWRCEPRGTAVSATPTRDTLDVTVKYFLQQYEQEAALFQNACIYK